MPVSNNNTYYITNSGAPERALAMMTTVPANGVNVALSTLNYTPPQQWLFKDNRVLLYSNRSFCLDCYVGAGANFNNADLWTVSAAEIVNQQLIFLPEGSGYRIKLLNKNLYLTANADMDGSAAGKTPASTGNVYWRERYESCMQIWNATPANLPDPDVVLTVGKRPPNLNYAGGLYTMFPRGQCTWHAHGRAKEAAKKVITYSQSYGLNAKTWWTYVTNCPKSARPLPNAIAVWDDGGLYGHVAFVEQVDANYIYFTEANWDTPNGLLDASDGVVKRLTPQNFSTRGKYKLLGYLVL